MLDATTSSSANSWQWPGEASTTQGDCQVLRLSPAVVGLPIKSTLCDKKDAKKSSRWGRAMDKEGRCRTSPHHLRSSLTPSSSSKKEVLTTKGAVLTASGLRQAHVSRKSYQTSTLVPRPKKQLNVPPPPAKAGAAVTPFKGLAMSSNRIDRHDPRLTSFHNRNRERQLGENLRSPQPQDIAKAADYLKWLLPIVAKTSQYGATGSMEPSHRPLDSNKVDASLLTPQSSKKQSVGLLDSPSNPNAPPFNIEFSTTKSPRTTKKRTEAPCTLNYTPEKLKALLKTPQTAKTEMSLTESPCMDNMSPSVNLAKLLLESHALCSMAFPTAHQQLPSGKVSLYQQRSPYYTPDTLPHPSNECKVTPLLSGSFDSPPYLLHEPFKIKRGDGGAATNEETQATLSTESISNPNDSPRQSSLDDDESCSSFDSCSSYSSSHTDSSSTSEDNCSSDISCTASGSSCLSREEEEEEEEMDEEEEADEEDSYMSEESSFSDTSEYTSAPEDVMNILPLEEEKGLPKHLKRFDPKERPLKDQMYCLSEGRRNVVALLRHHWDADHRPMPGHLYLRFAQYCQFNLANGRKLLSTFDEKMLKLTASQLEPQLCKQMMFPIPGLKSMYGNDMFFIRPALFNPHQMTTQAIKVMLSYVMLTMAEKEEAATDGVACILFMNDRTTENFSMDYCWQFMKMLQAAAPTRVSLFLLVNPPSWFGMIWQITKRMLHPTFQQKVRMIPERLLSQYLAPGYQAFLPKGTSAGTLDVTQQVQHFIEYRKYVEEKKGKPMDL